jgi:glycosyltransferase involved in cell wall biosynthesis
MQESIEEGFSVKVLHVVTLHTPTHDFGGPTRVALSLSKGLRNRGVDARIATLGDKFEGPLPTSIEDVPAFMYQARHVLPQFEVSGITSPALIARARRLVKAADVVHVHLMRDLITLPFALVALQCGRPLVLQTHGMIDPTEKRVAQLVDVLGLRRVLRRADAILHLTEAERDDVEAVVTPARLRRTHRLVNGVQLQERRPANDGGRPPTVLYCARVEIVKRPGDFVSAIPTVLAKYPDARFVLAGPDTGALAGPMMDLARELGVDHAVEYVGALEHAEVLERMRQTDVYVLPSIKERFSVSALEAMAAGVPVVVTSSGGLSPDIEAAGAGRLVDSRHAADNGPLVGQAILELLDPATNEEASVAGWRLVRDRFTIEKVIDTLQEVYEGVTTR